MKMEMLGSQMVIRIHFQPGGPKLLHFWEAGFREVLERAKFCWQKILDAKIPIPPSAVRTYTSDGSALGCDNHTNG